MFGILASTLDYNVKVVVLAKESSMNCKLKVWV